MTGVLIAVALGMAAGWWSGVVWWRWPRGLALRGRPRCGRCGRRLGARECAPVVSWLVQRGRCRGCGGRIPWQLPLIELACAAAAGAAVAGAGVGWRGASVAVLLAALVPVVAVDLEHRLVPDPVVVAATVAGLGLAVAAAPARWWVPAAAGVGSAAALGVPALVRPGGLGMGDVKLALPIGAVLGPAAGPALLVAFLAGGVVAAGIVAARGRAALGVAIPFAPFLAAGAVAGLVAGPDLLAWGSGWPGAP